MPAVILSLRLSGGNSNESEIVDFGEKIGHTNKRNLENINFLARNIEKINAKRTCAPPYRFRRKKEAELQNKN